MCIYIYTHTSTGQLETRQQETQILDLAHQNTYPCMRQDALHKEPYREFYKES